MGGIGGYEQIIGEARDLLVSNVTVKVLSLAQLIATKRSAGRPKDLAVIPVLEATLEHQQKQEPPADDSPAGS